ncbi:MAG: DNA translocase FtsK 4TM domain-containing protein, partial [Proteobacteria bacterium]|nr:DNA translocase FtsK 4TM domain-containing protein [Pseudomonadota bacterium]
MAKQATVKSGAVKLFTDHLGKRVREGFLIISAAVSLFILLALLTYHPTDPGWSHSEMVKEVANACGV